MKKTFQIRVYGRVQGVWFRKRASEQAQNLGIVGTAQNKKDGSVEILAQGEIEGLELFLLWCRIGPPGANVERLEYLELDADINLHGFIILPSE